MKIGTIMRIQSLMTVFLLVFLVIGQSTACVLAPEFHQVTVIRGRIVGKSLGLFGFRWLRQSFSVGAATLTLYEYRFPSKTVDWAKAEPAKEIVTITADPHGNFDFGSIPDGYYSVGVNVGNSGRMGGLFFVQITDKVRATDKITLDVSPIKPDCTGGNEFIEKKL